MNKKPQPIPDPDSFELPECTIEVKVVGGGIFISDDDMKKFDNYARDMRTLLLEPVPIYAFLAPELRRRRARRFGF